MLFDHALMRRIGVAVQEGDDDAFGAGGFGPGQRGGDRGLLRHDLGLAVRVHALVQRDDTVARHQRRRPAREQIVGIGNLQARQLENVAKAFGDEQA